MNLIPETRKIHIVQENLARTKHRLRSTIDELRWVQEDGKELADRSEFNAVLNTAYDAAKTLKVALDDMTKVLIEIMKEQREG